MAKIVMPVAADFEDSEFSKPYEALKQAGHEVVVIGLQPGPVSGKQKQATATVERTAQGLDVDDFDAMVIPGGYSPSKLRQDPTMVDFVRRFAQTGKLIAAVCHGPQLLIAADAVAGRTLTSWPAVREELENAGAQWVDREVAEDNNFVTSRMPDDLDAFNQAILNRLAQAYSTEPGFAARVTMPNPATTV